VAYRDQQDADSPLLRWRFEEASGAFVEDIIGSTANLTATGGTVTYQAATDIMAGYSVGLTAGGGYLAGNVAAASSWNAKTIEAIVVFTATPGGTTSAYRAPIWQHADGTGSQSIPLALGWNLDGSHSGQIGFGYFSGGAGAYRAIYWTPTLNTLYHLVGVYDGSTGLTLYANGSVVASGTVTARTAATYATTFYVGRRGWDGTQIESFPGRIYDLALYNASLSSTQVGTHYSWSVPPGISGGGSLSANAGTSGVLSGGGQLSIRAGVSLRDPVSGGGDLNVVSEDYDDNPGPDRAGPAGHRTGPARGRAAGPGPGPRRPGAAPGPRRPRAHGAERDAGVPHVRGAVQGAWRPPRVGSHESTVVEEWGHWRIYVSGVDRTIFRGAPTRIGSYSLAEPFGCGPASLVVPMITPWDQPGHGSLTWLQPGEPVVISRVKPNGATEGRWWGVIGSEDPQLDQDSWTYSVSLVGNAWVGDLQTHKPKTYLPPTDIGRVIPDALNAVVSRRVPKMDRVTTGILTTQRGSSDSGVLEYAQGLLATATTDDGTGQWTVARATGVNKQSLILKLKDRTTQHWSIRAGQPGAAVDVQRDATQAPNRIYGRGVATDGYSWANWVYPNAGPDAAPAYPFSSPGAVITIGTTDTDTDTDDGVSTWQRRINDLNITGNVSVDGVYNSNDAAACRVVQGHYGLAVDGVVGPQTWAATFDVGGNGSSLDGAFRLPLAYDKHVMPRLYHADGSDAGPNPYYDATMLVVDRDENFGPGVSKTEGRRSAVAELARERTPGWAGTITLSADPPEGSRWDVREGQNILLRGWFRVDVLLHIAQVVADPWSGTVTLTVDEKARDLVTLGGILSRNRDSKDDPARLPSRKLRRSRLTPDAVVEFDGESAGGFIPKHALFGGLWTVIRIPVSQAGQIAKLQFTTTNPASKFLVALFGDAITPAQLIAQVGANPLATRSDGYGPFDQAGDDLVQQFGFIEAFGGPGQAAGYDPGYETSPYTGGSTTVTGKLRSNASITYRSVRPRGFGSPNTPPTRASSPAASTPPPRRPDGHMGGEDVDVRRSGRHLQQPAEHGTPPVHGRVHPAAGVRWAGAADRQRRARVLRASRRVRVPQQRDDLDGGVPDTGAAARRHELRHRERILQRRHLVAVVTQHRDHPRDIHRERE
jgi:hypothetical protein